MGRKYGMLDIDEKYNGFSCEYSEQTGRLLAGIFGRYIEDGYKIGVDMDGETVDIRQYHGHFKHDLNPLLPTTKMVKMDLSGVYTILESLAQNRLFS